MRRQTNEQTDRETYRHADRDTLHRTGGEVKAMYWIQLSKINPTSTCYKAN